MSKNLMLVVDDKIKPRSWGTVVASNLECPPENILTASWGDEAYSTYQSEIEKGNRFDLVLSDYHMNVKRKPPEGSLRTRFRDVNLLCGISLASAIFLINPDQKFVLTSAGLTRDIRSLANEAGINLALYKRRPEDKKFSEYVDAIRNYTYEQKHALSHQKCEPEYMKRFCG